MKRLFYSIMTMVALVAISFSTTAQTGYEVSVGKRTLNFKDSTVFVLEVQRAVEKDVQTAWKKMIERNKVKARITNDQLSISQVVIESVDADPIDIYSTVVQQDKSVKLYTVFIVDGERVDPNGKEGASVKVRGLLAKFGGQVYHEVLTREIEVKKEVLEELEKTRAKNIKEQNKIDKAIQKDSLKIGSEETEISLLKGQLESATDRFTAQKSKIASTNFANKDDAKEAKSQLKGYKKDRKRIEKEIESRHDDILDLKSEIRDYWYKHAQLKKEETSILEKVTAQRELVKNSEEELLK